MGFGEVVSEEDGLIPPTLLIVSVILPDYVVSNCSNKSLTLRDSLPQCPPLILDFIIGNR